MRIDGSGHSFMPPHIARAYGVNPANATRSANPLNAPAAPAAPTAPSAPAASGTAAGPTSMRFPGHAQALVAARVPGPIEFDGVSVPRSTPAALSLYTRAADKIEAATAVHIGRTLDVKG